MTKFSESGLPKVNLDIPMPAVSPPRSEGGPALPLSAEDQRALDAAAWRNRGVLIISVDAMTDDWERHALTTIATRLYGPRQP
jgi:hypothetical protein